MFGLNVALCMFRLQTRRRPAAMIFAREFLASAMLIWLSWEKKIEV